MKLTDKVIEQIIGESVGDDAYRIVKFMREKKDLSEFKISTSLKLEIQEVRNVLYRLHNKNLAVYKRKKDNKKGWYVSYWTFDKNNLRQLAKNLNKEKLEKYKERLEIESNNANSFFMCKKACTRMDFHSAITYQFRCGECGMIMDQQDNTKTIDFLKEKIKEFETAV